PAQIERVVDKQIDELRAMVSAKGVTIELDPLARAWLAASGFDRAFGARPMARLIERKVKKPLSEAMLFGSLAEGGAARIVVEGDDVKVVATTTNDQRPTTDDQMSLADIRREYLGEPLSETNCEADPLRQFARWFDQVRELESDP